MRIDNRALIKLYQYYCIPVQMRRWFFVWLCCEAWGSTSEADYLTSILEILIKQVLSSSLLPADHRCEAVDHGKIFDVIVRSTLVMFLRRAIMSNIREYFFADIIYCGMWHFMGDDQILTMK